MKSLLTLQTRKMVCETISVWEKLQKRPEFIWLKANDRFGFFFNFQPNPDGIPTGSFAVRVLRTRPSRHLVPARSRLFLFLGPFCTRKAQTLKRSKAAGAVYGSLDVPESLGVSSALTLGNRPRSRHVPIYPLGLPPPRAFPQLSSPRQSDRRKPLNFLNSSN
ncbi:hypothetical protein L596_020650 [Steinernema carpocapsae]|uniref:Uncharacterized protein n=1 Tax=Steinernema carpocapsae TaxID=34508 RepID=A0A4U5MU86_STECR|nr:hypothetical protein L596_020650 [Steinernema carpocapsae]